MVQPQYLDTFSPFDGTDRTRFIIDEMGMWPVSETRHYLMTRQEVKERFGQDFIFPKYKSKRLPKVKIPVYGKRIPRKKKNDFYIVKKKPGRLNYGLPADFKRLYQQPKGKLVPYRRESFDLSWMKPIVWKFTAIGKKTTNLIKKLYGRSIRK